MSMAIAGALKGLGAGLVEQALQMRKEAWAEVERQRDLEDYWTKLEMREELKRGGRRGGRSRSGGAPRRGPGIGVAVDGNPDNGSTGGPGTDRRRGISQSIISEIEDRMADLGLDPTNAADLDAIIGETERHYAALGRNASAREAMERTFAALKVNEETEKRSFLGIDRLAKDGVSHKFGGFNYGDQPEEPVQSPATQPGQQPGLKRATNKGAGINITKIPPGAIEMLRDDPSLKQKFDAKYGKGAADAVLGQ